MLVQNAVRHGFLMRPDTGIRYAFTGVPGIGTRIIWENDTANFARYGSHASWAMVEHNICPAVLSEDGFISNSGDRTLMASPSRWREVAQYHYNAIREFFEGGQ